MLNYTTTKSLTPQTKIGNRILTTTKLCLSNPYPHPASRTTTTTSTNNTYTYHDPYHTCPLHAHEMRNIRITHTTLNAGPPTRTSVRVTYNSLKWPTDPRPPLCLYRPLTPLVPLTPIAPIARMCVIAPIPPLRRHAPIRERVRSVNTTMAFGR